MTCYPLTQTSLFTFYYLHTDDFLCKDCIQPHGTASTHRLWITISVSAVFRKQPNTEEPAFKQITGCENNSLFFKWQTHFYRLQPTVIPKLRIVPLPNLLNPLTLQVQQSNLDIHKRKKNSILKLSVQYHDTENSKFLTCSPSNSFAEEQN